MILTPEIETLILDAIKKHPDSPIVLPDFCYWRGRDQPVVYIDSLPESLSRVLYKKVIGPLDYGQHLLLKEGVTKRNVNPYLFTVETRIKRGHVCPNGHEYANGNEMPENRGRWRCRKCYMDWLERGRTGEGGPNVGDINRAKVTCPEGHPLEGDNLQILKNGKRRCAQCHRDQMAWYRHNKRIEAAKAREELVDA